MNWPSENPSFGDGQLEVFVYRKGQSLVISRVAETEVRSFFTVNMDLNNPWMPGDFTDQSQKCSERTLETDDEWRWYLGQVKL